MKRGHNPLHIPSALFLTVLSLSKHTKIQSWQESYSVAFMFLSLFYFPDTHWDAECTALVGISLRLPRSFFAYPRHKVKWTEVCIWYILLFFYFYFSSLSIFFMEGVHVPPKRAPCRSSYFSPAPTGNSSSSLPATYQCYQAGTLIVFKPVSARATETCKHTVSTLWIIFLYQISTSQWN